MDKLRALPAFAAPTQAARLDVLRLLLRHRAEAALSGQIGTALGVKQTAMSGRLAVLLHAGLVRNARQGRAVRRAADVDGIPGLPGFPREDCGGGRPELCRPPIEELACDCRGTP